MSLIGLVVFLVGLLGFVLSYVNIAIHAYREHGPGWGVTCLLVPNVNLLWGAVHWAEEDARRLFLKYLGYAVALVVGLIMMQAH